MQHIPTKNIERPPRKHIVPSKPSKQSLVARGLAANEKAASRILSKNAFKKVQTPGFSFHHSSDSDADQVYFVTKRLDKCASLLNNILEEKENIQKKKTNLKSKPNQIGKKHAQKKAVKIVLPTDSVKDPLLAGNRKVAESSARMITSTPTVNKGEKQLVKKKEDELRNKLSEIEREKQILQEQYSNLLQQNVKATASHPATKTPERFALNYTPVAIGQPTPCHTGVTSSEQLSENQSSSHRADPTSQDLMLLPIFKKLENTVNSISDKLSLPGSLTLQSGSVADSYDVTTTSYASSLSYEGPRHDVIQLPASNAHSTREASSRPVGRSRGFRRSLSPLLQQEQLLKDVAARQKMNAWSFDGVAESAAIGDQSSQPYDIPGMVDALEGSNGCEAADEDDCDACSSNDESGRKEDGTIMRVEEQQQRKYGVKHTDSNHVFGERGVINIEQVIGGSNNSARSALRGDGCKRNEWKENAYQTAAQTCASISASNSAPTYTSTAAKGKRVSKVGVPRKQPKVNNNTNGVSGRDETRRARGKDKNVKDEQGKVVNIAKDKNAGKSDTEHQQQQKQEVVCSKDDKKAGCIESPDSGEGRKLALTGVTSQLAAMQNDSNAKKHLTMLGKRGELVANGIKPRPGYAATQITMLSYLFRELVNLLGDRLNSEEGRLLTEMDYIIGLLPFLMNNLNPDLQTEISIAVQPIRVENSDLRRQLRIANQKLRDSELQVKQMESDLATAKKRSIDDDGLEKLKKQITIDEEQRRTFIAKIAEVTKAVDELRLENRDLAQKLADKDAGDANGVRQMQKEKSILMSENSLLTSKLESLSLTLQAQQKENKILKMSISQSEAEVSRCKELNRGLQESVAKLLHDVNFKDSRTLTRKVGGTELKHPHGKLKPEVGSSGRGVAGNNENRNAGIRTGTVKSQRVGYNVGNTDAENVSEWKPVSRSKTSSGNIPVDDVSSDTASEALSSTLTSESNKECCSVVESETTSCNDSLYSISIDDRYSTLTCDSGEFQLDLANLDADIRKLQLSLKSAKAT
eukprot:gene17727-19499_t